MINHQKQDNIKNQIISNLTAFYQSFKNAENADFSEHENLFFFNIKNSPWLNLAINKNYPLQDINKLFDKINRYNENSPKPINWIIQEEDAKKNINLLQASGFAPIKVWENMHLDENRVLTNSEKNNFEIRKVSHNDDLKCWINILAKTDPNANFNFKDFFPLMKDKRVTFFIGYYNHVPIATSLIFRNNGVAGLYFIAVIKEYRKLGFGKSLTIFPIVDAQKQGVRSFVLHATKSGKNIYKKIGFENYGKMYIFAKK